MSADIYWIDDNKHYTAQGGHSVMFREFPSIEGVTSFEVHGVKALVPKDYEKFLEAIYGPSWKHPDPNFKHENVAKTEDGLEAIRVDYE